MQLLHSCRKRKQLRCSFPTQFSNFHASCLFSLFLILSFTFVIEREKKNWQEEKTTHHSVVCVSFKFTFSSSSLRSSETFFIISQFYFYIFCFRQTCDKSFFVLLQILLWLHHEYEDKTGIRFRLNFSLFIIESSGIYNWAFTYSWLNPLIDLESVKSINHWLLWVKTGLHSRWLKAEVWFIKPLEVAE